MAEPREPVRLSVNLAPEVADDLRAMAAAAQTSVTDIVRRAIGTEKFMQEARKRNAKILVEETDKTVKQIVLR